MIANDSLKKGRIAEYFMASSFLKRDWEVFFPAVDSNGVDIILKVGETFLEIQVKARKIFRSEQTFTVREFPPRKNYFICLFDLHSQNYYLFPADFIRKIAKVWGNKSKWYVVEWGLLQKHNEFRNWRGLDKIAEEFE